MVWQLCFALCNREKQVFQPCYGDNQSPCRTDSFFSKMQFHYTQRGKKIFPRNRRVPGELKQLPPRSSLPSLPIAPIIGREDPWLAGLGGLSSAVQRTVCPLKSARSSSCQLTGMSCGCLQSPVAGLFLFLQPSVSIPGLETNLQKRSKRYSSCWSNI